MSAARPAIKKVLAGRPGPQALADWSLANAEAKEKSPRRSDTMIGTGGASLRCECGVMLLGIYNTLILELRYPNA